ncbi:unnamed protein product [Cylindrotheca closterium]|uniref:RING-type domain-containing protein n=1 Tax=Cylindrotheca closterium TaxID=2856 RepID=A0AAD2PVR3_9STRA|nr:unnamed protein product [Cylindrotheca closterium]
MSSSVTMFGTVVLTLVLPCAIILCLFLHCYTKYLRRRDGEELEAFRVQAQARRMMRQQQINGRRGDNNENDDDAIASQTTTNNKKLLSDVFLFHTIQQNDKSIPWQTQNQNTKNADATEITFCTDSDAPASSNDDEQYNRNSSANEGTIASASEAAAEPNGIKLRDETNDDLEVGIMTPSSSKSHCSSVHSCQSFNAFRDRVFGGTAMSADSNNNNNKKNNTKKRSKRTKKKIEKHPTYFASNRSNPSRRSRILREAAAAGEEDDDDLDKDCCCICLEGYATGEVICTPKQEDCNHIFHKECLFEWIQHQNHDCCPLCRVVLIE